MRNTCECLQDTSMGATSVYGRASEYSSLKIRNGWISASGKNRRLCFGGNTLYNRDSSKHNDKKRCEWVTTIPLG